VTLYNAVTGDILQELAKIDKGSNSLQKFRFKIGAVNIENR
jgi:hypothetical protein